MQSCRQLGYFIGVYYVPVFEFSIFELKWLQVTLLCSEHCHLLNKGHNTCIYSYRKRRGNYKEPNITAGCCTQSRAVVLFFWLNADSLCKKYEAGITGILTTAKAKFPSCCSSEQSCYVGTVNSKLTTVLIYFLFYATARIKGLLKDKTAL